MNGEIVEDCNFDESASSRLQFWAVELGIFNEGNGFGENIGSDEYLKWAASELEHADPKTQLSQQDYLTICADLRRTQPNDPSFQQQHVQDWMARALTLVLSERKALYMQGLQDVLVPCMLVDTADKGLDQSLPPPTVYALFSAFLAKFLPCIFCEQDAQIVALRCQLELMRQLVMYHDPVFANFLDQQGMAPNIFATPWVVTVFTSKFPLDVVMHFWDLLLESGDPMMHHFFMAAFLIHHRDSVLEDPSVDVPEVLTTLTVTEASEVNTVWQLADILRLRSPLGYHQAVYELCYDPQGALADRSAVLNRFELFPCIEVTSEDISRSLIAPGDNNEQEEGLEPFQYILMDCRPQRYVESGYICGAVRLDPSLLLTVANTETAMQQEDVLTQMIAFLQPLSAEHHFVFMGLWDGGVPDRDTQNFVRHFTNLNFEHVALVRGGVAAIAKDLADQGVQPVNGVFTPPVSQELLPQWMVLGPVDAESMSPMSTGAGGPLGKRTDVSDQEDTTGATSPRLLPAAEPAAKHAQPKMFQNQWEQNSVDLPNKQSNAMAKIKGPDQDKNPHFWDVVTDSTSPTSNSSPPMRGNAQARQKLEVRTAEEMDSSFYQLPLSPKVDVSMEQALSRSPEAVLQIWNRHMEELAVCQTALKYFKKTTALSMNERKEVIVAGTNSMYGHPDRVEIYSDVCQLLLQLAVEDECKKVLLDLKAAGLMVAGLRSFLGSTEAASVGMKALCLMAIEDQNRLAMTEAGVVGASVKIMRNHRANPDILETGTKLLHLLCFSEENKSAVLKAGGVAVILWAMDLYVANIDIATNGCGVLYFLAFDLDSQGEMVVSQEDMVTHEAVLDTVVGAMQHHPTNVDIQTTGLAVMHSMAFDSSLLLSIAARGGLDMLSSCLKCLAGDEEPIRDMVELLDMLLQNGPCREVLLVHEGGTGAPGPGKVVLDFAAVLEQAISSVVTDKPSQEAQELALKGNEVLCAVRGLSEELRVNEIAQQQAFPLENNPTKSILNENSADFQREELVPVAELQKVNTNNMLLKEEVAELKQKLGEIRLRLEAEMRHSKETEYRLAVAEVVIRQNPQNSDKGKPITELLARNKVLEEAAKVAQDEAQDAVTKFEEAIDLNKQVHQQLSVSTSELTSEKKRADKSEEKAKALQRDLEAARQLLLQQKQRHTNAGFEDPSQTPFRELSQALEVALTDMRRSEHAREKERSEFQIVVRHLQDQQRKAEEERDAVLAELVAMQTNQSRFSREASEREQMAAEEILILRSTYRQITQRLTRGKVLATVPILQRRPSAGSSSSKWKRSPSSTFKKVPDHKEFDFFPDIGQELRDKVVTCLKAVFTELASVPSTRGKSVRRKGDALVLPTIRARRFIQQSSLLHTGSRLTLADVDMALKLGVAGNGTVNKGGGSAAGVTFAGFCGALVSLAQKRYPSKSSAECLSKLLEAVAPNNASIDLEQDEHNETTITAHQSSPANQSSGNSLHQPFQSSHCPPKSNMWGVERVLSRNRRALALIFNFYADDLPQAHSYTYNSGLESKVLNFKSIMEFTRDFCLSPGLLKKKNCQEMYCQIIYGNRIIPESVGNPLDDEELGTGLSFDGFITWLGLASTECEWFQKQQGFDRCVDKMLGILQWMDSSVGKEKIVKSRNQQVIPPFDITPLPEDDPANI